MNTDQPNLMKMLCATRFGAAGYELALRGLIGLIAPTRG